MDTVLIVDDQAAVRTSLEMFFEVHGVRAESVATPAAAIERVSRGGVALVLQDMNFASDTTSGEEGVALFRKIRALDGAMPVLLITAWTSLETAVALVKEGAADYLAKPWNDDKLLAAVRTHLRMRALERENVRLRVEAFRDRAALAAAHDLCGHRLREPGDAQAGLARGRGRSFGRAGARSRGERRREGEAREGRGWERNYIPRRKRTPPHRSGWGRHTLRSPHSSSPPVPEDHRGGPAGDRRVGLGAQRAAPPPPRPPSLPTPPTILSSFRSAEARKGSSGPVVVNFFDCFF
jgi:FixJ family two-component response regulator